MGSSLGYQGEGQGRSAVVVVCVFSNNEENRKNYTNAKAERHRRSETGREGVREGGSEGERRYCCTVYMCVLCAL